MALSNENSQEEDDTDARTVFCANLSEKATDALLYELFLQVSFNLMKELRKNILIVFRISQGGPVERVSIPKDKDGAQRSFGFITYKHVDSVRYAMNIFTGTKLFNRELRLNNRNANGNNRNEQKQQQQQQHQLQQRPPHDYQIQTSAHIQMQMQQFLSTCNQPPAMANLSALQAGGLGNTNLMTTLSGMQPKNNTSVPKKDELPQLFDTSALIAFGSQMLHGGSSTSLPQSFNTNLNSLDAGSNNHQSKILHRHENRPHHQNNYTRRNDSNRDRRNGQDRDRRSRWDRDGDRENNRERARDRDKDRADRLDQAYERLDRERDRDRDNNNRRNKYNRRT